MNATELIEAMARLAITAQELATDAGCSIDTIRSARSGRRPVPERVIETIEEYGCEAEGRRAK